MDVDFHGHFEISRSFLMVDQRLASMKEFVPKKAYDMQILAIFSNFICILISRTFEGAIKNIIYTKSMLRENDVGQLEEVRKKLKDFQNPEKSKIYNCFKEHLNIEIKDEDFGENANDLFTAIGQIVGDRHKIAHSDETLQLDPTMKTLEEVEKHYINVKKFVSRLCEISEMNN
jgi:hypothetical protein